MKRLSFRREGESARKAREQAEKAHHAEQARLAKQSRLQGNMQRKAAEIRARQARRGGAR